MKDAAKTSYAAGAIFDDYAIRPVPEENRISWTIQGSVWAGICFCASLFSVSGIMAAAMTPIRFTATVLLGTILITVIASLNGFIGAKTHLSASFNARFALGAEGGKLFGLILAISLFGWFGCQCVDFADSTVSTLQMFGFPGGSRSIWAIIGGLLMMITVIAGLKGITLLSTLGAPLLFALGLAAAVITVHRVDVPTLLTVSSASGSSMSLVDGIGIVVSCLITGACMISDLSRFSKNTKHASGACVLGFLIAFPVLLLLGGFFYYAYGTSDLCEVLTAHCSLGVFVPFVLVVSIWTTNDYNLYCAVLGISNALNEHIALPRWLLTLVMGVVSTLLGALGIMEGFVSFLNLLNALVPPVAAVIIADYYLYNRDTGLYAYERAGTLQNFRGSTCLSALIGIVAGLLCNYTNIGFLRTWCSVIPSCILEMLVSVVALIVYNMVVHSKIPAAVSLR